MNSITRAPWRSSDRAPSSPFGVPPDRQIMTQRPPREMTRRETELELRQMPYRRRDVARFKALRIALAEKLDEECGWNMGGKL
jgi:hypothetical protein